MKEFVKTIKEVSKEIIKDETGGPGLEEAILLVFVALAVSDAADNLGDIIDSAFTSASSNLKTALGIT